MSLWYHSDKKNGWLMTLAEPILPIVHIYCTESNTKSINNEDKREHVEWQSQTGWITGLLSHIPSGITHEYTKEQYSQGYISTFDTSNRYSYKYCTKFTNCHYFIKWILSNNTKIMRTRFGKYTEQSQLLFSPAGYIWLHKTVSNEQ